MENSLCDDVVEKILDNLNYIELHQMSQTSSYFREKSKAKMKILEDKNVEFLNNNYPEYIIHGFGGIDILKKCHFIEQEKFNNDWISRTYIDLVCFNELEDTMCIGLDSYFRPYILLACCRYRHNRKKYPIETIFQKYSDNIGTWTTGGDNIFFGSTYYDLYSAQELTQEIVIALFNSRMSNLRQPCKRHFYSHISKKYEAVEKQIQNCVYEIDGSKKTIENYKYDVNNNLRIDIF